MLKIQHRINTIEDLKLHSNKVGVELDLRYHEDRIILHHDPFVSGEDFESYLQQFNLDFIILNIKSEGIEEKVLNLVEKYNIKDYFFLDVSIPFMIKYIKKGWRKFAIRYSEFEPLELVRQFEGKVDWVWVDCFNELPLDESSYLYLKKHFKICIVSPELQSHPIDKISEYKEKLMSMDIDAVCTKRPDLW